MSVYVCASVNDFNVGSISKTRWQFHSSSQALRHTAPLQLAIDHPVGLQMVRDAMMFFLWDV
jgi:hypothetical protein